MGVRGLTTYIADNSKLYLKPHELCDTYLVIDGNNIASHTYKWLSQCDSAFGGDYDEYYKVVKDFFQMLKRCGVTPIVLFDGAYEKKKIKTVLSRSIAKYPLLRSLHNGFSPQKFFPLFMKQTFFDVMEDLEIFCVQCDFEADVEIATVARALNCPVLSYDSDFYIYDVLYIPFSSVHNEVSREEDEHGKVRFFIKCLIYDVTNFLNEFSGLNKSLLPIIATLLGNDYIDSHIFKKFFLHVAFPKIKNKSFTQKKIPAVLHWLKKETIESATKLIISHLEKKHTDKVLHAINTSINDYTKSCVSLPVFSGLNKLIKSKGGSCLKLEASRINCSLPATIIELFYKCKLHKFIMDIISLGIYFSQIQIENVHQKSSHFTALKLISAIFSMLLPYINKETKSPFVYLTIKNHYNSMNISNDLIDFLKNIDLSEILKEPANVRLKLLYKIIGSSDEEIKTVSAFSSDWINFVLAFLYWIKELNNSITLAQIHALLLMVVANKIVQSKVGYFRVQSKFTKKRGNLLNELSNSVLEPSDKTEESFEELLDNVTMYECLLIQKNLIPFRQTTEKGRGKGYCVLTVHLFNCFQSCLYHIMQLNALLNYPLEHLKISDFYSGTLLFNFYLKIIDNPDVQKFSCDLLKETPNLAKIYEFICRNLCKYSVKEYIYVPIKKKKRKHKKFNKKEKCEVFNFTATDDEETNLYDDDNNLYALLQNVKIN